MGNKFLLDSVNVHNGWDNNIGIGKFNESTGQQEAGPDQSRTIACKTYNGGCGKHAWGDAPNGYYFQGAGIDALTATSFVISDCTDYGSRNGFWADINGGATGVFTACIAKNTVVGLIWSDSATGGNQPWNTGGFGQTITGPGTGWLKTPGGCAFYSGTYGVNFINCVSENAGLYGFVTDYYSSKNVLEGCRVYNSGATAFVFCGTGHKATNIVAEGACQSNGTTAPSGSVFPAQPAILVTGMAGTDPSEIINSTVELTSVVVSPGQVYPVSSMPAAKYNYAIYARTRNSQSCKAFLLGSSNDALVAGTAGLFLADSGSKIVAFHTISDQLTVHSEGSSAILNIQQGSNNAVQALQDTSGNFTLHNYKNDAVTTFSQGRTGGSPKGITLWSGSVRLNNIPSDPSGLFANDVWNYNGVLRADAVGASHPAMIVPTLADLKALTSRPAVVTVEGYSAVGDQGGGTFTWLAGDSTTANDGIYVQCTSGPAGRYKRMYSGELNVKWFGAKGDNSTNDYAALQATINAAATFVNGATVFFPEGVYLKNATLNITTPGIVLRGEGGMRSTIIIDTAAAGDGIKATGVDGIWIEDISFQATVTKNSDTAAAHFDNCHMSGMRCFRINYHYHAIKCTGGSAQYIYEFDTGDIGQTTGHAIIVGENGLLVQGLILNDIQIHYCDGDGIALYSVSGISAYNVSIAGCKNSITTYPSGFIKTGNTHSNTTIDNLDTSGLNVGMVINSSGVFGTITSIGATSVTIDTPISYTSTGVSFYFYNRVVAGLWENVVCDTSDEHGLRLWTNGGVVAGHVFTSLWACSHGADDRSNPNYHGVYIVPGGNAQSVVQGITFDGPLLANNAGAGMQIGEGAPTQVRYIGISNPNISQNSVAGSGLKPGISIYPGVSHVSINGGFSSGNAQVLVGVPNLQSYGVLVGSGTGSNIVISGIDVTNNVVGGISMGATGINNYITNCPGYTLGGSTAVSVPTLAALKSMPILSDVVYMEGRVVTTPYGGGGTFAWIPGDQSANVTKDPTNGIWVPPNTDTTGASGAWQRQWEGDDIRPEWFGDINNESIDTYAAGQAAIDWIKNNLPTGAVLKFGPRAYWKSGEWLITSNRVILRGSGVATQIVEMVAGGNGIHFQNCDRPMLEYMYLWSNLTKSPGTSGVWFDNCHDAYIKDFRIEKHHHALRCTADWQQYLLYISHGDIGHCDGDGMRLGDTGTLVQGIFVDNVHITACDVGISQFNVSGFQSVDIDIIQCRISFTTYPYGTVKTGNTHSNTIIDNIAVTSDLNEFGVITIGTYRGAVTNIINSNSIEVWPPLSNTANAVPFYFFNQVVAGEHVGLVCDTSDQSGMQLYTNGGVLADQKFYYLRSGANGVTSNVAIGVDIVSGGHSLSEIRDIQFSQLWAEQNGGHGVRIGTNQGSVHHIGFMQSSISDNSLANVNIRDGVYIDGPNVSHIQVIGGHVSNAPLIAHINQQRYGIYIGSSFSDYLIINSVDVTGNVSGGLVNASSSSNVIISGVQGYTNRNRGTSSISAATSVSVTHNLNETPLINGITITPTSDIGSGIRYWVSAVNSTTFTLTTSASASFSFAWEVYGPTAK